jgi:hypothetical protein
MADPSATIDLQFRTDLHSYVTEFGWGNKHALSFQLALALLASALESDHRALLLHARFAESVLTELHVLNSWMLTEPYLKHWAVSVEERVGLHWVREAGAYLEEINP